VYAGWRIRRSFGRGADRHFRIRGWLIFSFGLIGWFVWGTTAMAMAPHPPAVRPLMLPAGFIVGLFTGHCVAVLIRPWMSAPDDDSCEVRADESC
jgi:hypothetical protein